MINWTIYYNPKCGTCRKALELLKKKKIQPHIVEYLKTPPSLGELERIAKKLGDSWREMIRTKEPIFEELNLKLDTASPTQILSVVVKNPILLQRPIVIKGNTAIVARPPEKIESFL